MQFRNYFILITVLISAVTLSFNNCSDVKFAKSSAESAGGGAGGGNGGLGDSEVPPNCYDGKCEPSNPIPQVQPDFNYTAKTPPTEVDIILILDDSASMGRERASLFAAMQPFLDALKNSKALDWRLCYTLTSFNPSDANDPSAGNGKAKSWAGVSNRKYLTISDSANLNTIFANTVNQITENVNENITWNEQGIPAISLMLNESSGCRRTTAALTTILISDEDNKSCGGRCIKTSTNRGADEPIQGSVFSDGQAKEGTDQYGPFGYWSFLQPLKSIDDPKALVAKIGADKPYTHHSIVIRGATAKNPTKDLNCYRENDQESYAFYGLEYQKLSELTGGIVGNVCNKNSSGQLDYGSQLSSVANRIGETINSVTLPCAPLTNSSGQISPGSVTYSSGTSHTHQVQGNKVVFSPALQNGESVKIMYSCLQ